MENCRLKKSLAIISCFAILFGCFQNSKLDEKAEDGNDVTDQFEMSSLKILTAGGRILYRA